MKKPQTTEDYTDNLTNPNTNSRLQAVKWLYENGDFRAVKPLVTLIMESYASEIRFWAIKGLFRINDEKAITLLIGELYQDETGHAAEALGELQDLRAVEPIITAFQSYASLPACLAAIEALGKLGDKRAIELFAWILENENYFSPHRWESVSSANLYKMDTVELQLAVISALEKIGGEQALLVLELLLTEEKHRNLWRAANLAIETIRKNQI